MKRIAIGLVLVGCGSKANDGPSCDAVATKMLSFMRDGDKADPALAKLDQTAKSMFVEQCTGLNTGQRTCIVAAKDEATMFTCLGAPPSSVTCAADARHVGPRPDEGDDEAGDEIRARFSMKPDDTWVEYCERNGKRHGPYRTIHRGREETGAYDNGAKSGTWKKMDRGSPVEQDEYKAGRREGAHVEYDGDGAVIESTMFKDDVEDGPYTKIASGDSPGVDGTYKAGVKVGTWTEKYAGGKPKSSIAYVDGKRVGPTTEFHESGNPKLVAMYIDDLLDGAYVETSDAGKKIAEGKYAEGKKVGKWSTAMPDGEKVWDGAFEHGKPVGAWTFYGAKGAIAATVTLAKDAEVEVEMNEDSIITAIDVKAAGKLSPHLEMFSTGQIKLSGGFLDGEKHGTWTELDGKGRKIVEVTWAAGKKTGPATSWYPESTQMQEQGTLVDAQWNGTWKHWFESGEISDDGNYVSGKKVGKWTSYTRAGKATVTEN